jgi:DNA-binding LacI/PurR family transcriptional regulator
VTKNDPDTRPATATINDVAALAGVSRSTTSRVLNGSGPASRQARDSVVRAADALGYQPNPAARSLVSGSGTRIVIGVVSASPQLHVDSYLGRVLAVAARLAHPERIGVTVQALPPGGSDALARWATDPTVHGVILVNTTKAMLAAVDRRLTGRIVSIGIGSPLVPSVDVDNAGAARAATRRLLDGGRRKIAMVTGPRWLPCAARSVRAYRDVLVAAGLPTRTVVGDFTTAAGRTAAREIMTRWPDTDAILAISDAPAFGVLAELAAADISAPDDVAVCGFDDLDFADVVGLTTATHPVERIAEQAVRTVLDTAAEGAANAMFESVPVVRRTA